MFLSLSCGIIASIEMFHNITKQMEIELDGYKSFYILSADIHKYLSLTDQHKTITGTVFLNDSYNRYIKLVDVSLVLKKKIDDKLVDIPIVNSSIPLTISTDTFTDTSSDESP
jgi:hypothetical protein